MRRAILDDAPALAVIHASAFETPWTAKALKGFMGDAGAITLVADDPKEGFILIRALAGEAEVLTLAVDPGSRRAGLGRALVEAAALSANEAGASSLFLEVAEDNLAALALYRAAGFEEAGRRSGYYRRANGPPMDALVLRRGLGAAGA